MNVDRDRQNLWAVFGISAGVATGVAAGVWLWRRRSIPHAGPAAVPAWLETSGSAQEVSASLRSDPKLSRRRVEVDTIAEGVIELSGAVRDREEAEHAVRLAQRTTGVYTVVNRLRVEDEESRRETTSRRWQDGAPELRERHHYGMSVGMGASRHSPTTDPDRPSDKQRIIERELDVANVDDASEAEQEPVSDASAEEATGTDGSERVDDGPGADPVDGGEGGRL